MLKVIDVKRSPIADVEETITPSLQDTTATSVVNYGLVPNTGWTRNTYKLHLKKIK